MSAPSRTSADRNPLMALGVELRQRREMAGLTVQEVSRKTGIGESIIYRLETGRNAGIRSSTLVVLAPLFDLGPDRIRELISDPSRADDVIRRLQLAASAPVLPPPADDAFVAMRGDEILRISDNDRIDDDVIGALRDLGFVILRPVT